MDLIFKYKQEVIIQRLQMIFYTFITYNIIKKKKVNV